MMRTMKTWIADWDQQTAWQRERKRGEREKEQVNRMYLPLWSNWLKTPIFAVTGKKNLGLDFGPNWLQNLNENKKHPLTVEVHQK